MRYLGIIFLFLSFSAFAYELVVIQGLSKSKQTFVTRNTQNIDVFIGKRATFTSENTSVIARAIEVTNEFIQWELENDFTDAPFPRGQLVTMYDTTEYLWALTPEKIKRKFIRNRVFRARRSFEGSFGFTRGISESVTQTLPANTDRGGYHFDFQFRQQININWAYSYGLRYDREVINLPDSSLINQRFMGIGHIRYYFDPWYDFYNSQVGISVGIGFGQSRTETAAQATFGNSVLLPETRLSLSIPIDRDTDMEFGAAFESFRLDEEDVNNQDQTTNLISSKVNIAYRRYID